MSNYICKVASLDEVKRREQFLIDTHDKDKVNWTKWAKERITFFEENKIIIYYGILDNEIICEATANLDKSVDSDSEGLIDDKTVYLSAFRTNKEYEGKGYFSLLYKFMLNDLINKGYIKATIGVSHSNTRNQEIYAHYGFTEKIKSTTDTYPNGKTSEVDYYGKRLR